MSLLRKLSSDRVTSESTKKKQKQTRTKKKSKKKSKKKRTKKRKKRRNGEDGRGIRRRVTGSAIGRTIRTNWRSAGHYAITASAPFVRPYRPHRSRHAEPTGPQPQPKKKQNKRKKKPKTKKKNKNKQNKPTKQNEWNRIRFREILSTLESFFLNRNQRVRHR